MRGPDLALRHFCPGCWTRTRRVGIRTFVWIPCPLYPSLLFGLRSFVRGNFVTQLFLTLSPSVTKNNTLQAVRLGAELVISPLLGLVGRSATTKPATGMLRVDRLLAILFSLVQTLTLMVPIEQDAN